MVVRLPGASHGYGLAHGATRVADPSSPPRRPCRRVGRVRAIGTVACGDDDDDDDVASTAAATKVTATSAAAAGNTGPATTDVAATGEATTGGDHTGGATTPWAASAPSVPPTAGGEGVTYTSPEGDYSAIFPAQPAEQRQDQPLPDGSTVELVIVGVEGADRFRPRRGASSRRERCSTCRSAGRRPGAGDRKRPGHAHRQPGRRAAGSTGPTVLGLVHEQRRGGTLLQRVYFDGPVIYQVLVTGAGELTSRSGDRRLLRLVPVLGRLTLVRVGFGAAIVQTETPQRSPACARSSPQPIGPIVTRARQGSCVSGLSARYTSNARREAAFIARSRDGAVRR